MAAWFGRDTRILYGATSASEKVQYNQRKELLQKLTQVRLLLRRNHGAGPYRDSFSNRFKRASHLLQEKWAGLVGSDSKKDEEFDSEGFSSITDFTESGYVLIQELLEINAAHDGKLVQAQQVLETRRQLLDREVLLSFYGQYNAGKSTILNSVLGNKFLPVSREPETSLTLCISPTLEGDETMSSVMIADAELEGPPSDDVRLNCLKENGVFVAFGVAEIYRYLLDKNKLRRNVTTSYTRDCFYILKARMPLVFNIPRGWKISFMDNPGFDEYSRDITEVALRGLGISSACLYVTTFNQYEQMQSANFFRSMYQSNKDVFIQKRLIIIVNKMDKVCCKGRLSYDSDEEELSENDVMSKVHAFIIKACHCSKEDVPRDVIIPLYGVWAYKARMLAAKPESVERREGVVKILLAANDQPSGQGENPESRFAGKRSCELAQELENLSHISLLERRLQAMAKGSVLMWVQKITNDLTLYLRGSKQKLSDKMDRFKRITQDLEEDVSYRLQVLTETYEMYRCIMQAINQSTPLWKKFEASFEEDMQTADLRAKALKTVKDLYNLEDFKDSFTSKIKSGTVYGPQEFGEDLSNLVHVISANLHEAINSRICFSHMLHVCSEEFRILTAEVARVGTRVESLSQNSGGYTSMMKKEMCASLQERLLLKCQKTIEMIRKKFLAFTIKDYIADFYDPADQYRTYFIEDSGLFYQPSQFSGEEYVKREMAITHRVSRVSPRMTSHAAQPIVAKHRASLQESSAVQPIMAKHQASSQESSAVQPITAKHRASVRESSAAQPITAKHQASLQVSSAAQPITAKHQASLQDSSAVQHVLTKPQTASQQVPEILPIQIEPPFNTRKMSAAAKPSTPTKKGSHDNVRDDRETPSTPSRSRNYKKWTCELEQVFTLLQGSIESEIEEYFDDFSDIVITKYCESYTESAMMSLRNFDDAFDDQLHREINVLNKDIDGLLEETEKLRKYSYQCSLLGYLLTQFVFVSNRHRKNLFT